MKRIVNLRKSKRPFSLKLLFRVPQKDWLSEKSLISFVLLGAFFLRFWDVFFGLSGVYHPDEPISVGIISRMLSTRDLNPHFFDWGSLYFYYLTYLCARKIYHDSKTSVLAGLFLAFCFLHVRCSHYMTVDITTTFFLMFSLWLILIAYERNSIFSYVVAGLVTGAAVATKYNTVVLFYLY